MKSGRVVIYSSLHPVNVHLVRNALTRAGLDSYMRAQHLAPLAGEVPFDDARTELYVNAEDERRATVIIRAALNVVGEDRICAQCGESNPFSFEICWRCQADLT